MSQTQNQEARFLTISSDRVATYKTKTVTLKATLRILDERAWTHEVHPEVVNYVLPRFQNWVQDVLGNNRGIPGISSAEEWEAHIRASCNIAPMEWSAGVPSTKNKMKLLILIKFLTCNILIDDLNEPHTEQDEYASTVLNFGKQLERIFSGKYQSWLDIEDEVVDFPVLGSDEYQRCLNIYFNFYQFCRKHSDLDEKHYNILGWRLKQGYQLLTWMGKKLDTIVGNSPELRSYLRKYTVLVRVHIELLMALDGVDAGKNIQRDDYYERMVMLAIDSVGYANDIISLEKECKTHVPGNVIVSLVENGNSLSKAIKIVAQSYNEGISEIAAIQGFLTTKRHEKPDGLEVDYEKLFELFCVTSLEDCAITLITLLAMANFQST